MGIAENMQGLTGNIRDSMEKRSEDLARIKLETGELKQKAGKMVNDFASSRGDAARLLKQDLAETRGGRSRQVRQGREKAQTMVRKMHNDRLAHNEQMRRDLAAGGRELAQGEIERKKQVNARLGEMRTSRSNSQEELKKGLADYRNRSTQQVRATLTGARDMINGLNSSRRSMRNSLKEELGSSSSRRKAEVEKMCGSFHAARSEVREGLQGAAKAWKEMESQRKEVPASAKSEAEGASTLPDANLNLEEKLVSVIDKHTEGITLSEVARELGLVTIVLGKAAKVLVDQGKVRREEKTYFPAGVR